MRERVVGFSSRPDFVPCCSTSTLFGLLCVCPSCGAGGCTLAHTHSHVCAKAVQQSCEEALYPAHLSANPAASLPRRPLLPHSSSMCFWAHFWAPRRQLACAVRLPAPLCRRVHRQAKLCVQHALRVSGVCTCKQASQHCVTWSGALWYWGNTSVCGLRFSHSDGCFGLWGAGFRLRVLVLACTCWPCLHDPFWTWQPCRTQSAAESWLFAGCCLGCMSTGFSAAARVHQRCAAVYGTL